MMRAVWLAVLVWAVPAFGQYDGLRRPGPDPVAVFERVGPERIFDQACEILEEGFYDPEVLRARGWAGLRARYRATAAQAATPEALHETINVMLGELETSHLVLMDRGVFQREILSELHHEARPRFGMELVEVDGRYFVDGIAEGGPAAEAGLRGGDEVLAIDGEPLLPGSELALGLDPAGHDPGLPGDPGYSLRPEPAERTLHVRSASGATPREVQVVARALTLYDAMEASARVEDVDGVSVGVIHLWHFMSMGTLQALQAALEGPLADAEGLVLDVRGRGGNIMVVMRILSLFRGRRAVWDKPVVLLIDRHTRSAKEIFAWLWRENEVGPIVGQRTQGACIGTGFRELMDGSILLVPFMDVRRFTGGETLEAVGVWPDVWVQQRPLPYRAGRDEILAEGLERVAAEVASVPR